VSPPAGILLGDFLAGTLLGDFLAGTLLGDFLAATLLGDSLAGTLLGDFWQGFSSHLRPYTKQRKGHLLSSKTLKPCKRNQSIVSTGTKVSTTASTTASTTVSTGRNDVKAPASCTAEPFVHPWRR